MPPERCAERGERVEGREAEKIRGWKRAEGRKGKEWKGNEDTEGTWKTYLQFWPYSEILNPPLVVN